jgi:small conductance mechanosensitive channel
MHWDWQKFYDQAYHWLLMYGPRVVVALIVFFIGIWLIRIVNRWIKKGLLVKRVNPSLRYFLQNLVAIGLQVLLVILALQIAGIELTFMSAVIAGFTVAIGLALSGTLNNFVSGILILLLRPYRVGDNISAQGQEGTVTSIQLFFTTVLTFDNKTIIIPNGQLSNNVIINLSREGKRRLDVQLKFGYAVDFGEVKKILETSIHSSKLINADPPHRIGLSFADYDRYTVTVNVWVNAHGFYDTCFVLQEKFITDLKAAGIKFPGM